MKLLIGVSGKLGSGKDYIVNNLIIPILQERNIRHLQFNFADQLKINVMTKNNIEYDDVYERKTEFSRQLLQKEGTEIGRNINKNVWIDYFENWVKVLGNRGIQSFVISDVRFKNEFEYIKHNCGLLIKVVSKQRNQDRLHQESVGNKQTFDKIKNHISECDLDDIPDEKYDMVIYNEDIMNIVEEKEKVSTLLNKYTNI